MISHPAEKLERIRAAMRQEWDDQALVVARRRWREKLVAWGRGVTRAIVEEARLVPGMTVLDVACGLGDPAFSLAQTVSPAGKVIATDFSAPMIAAAEQIAHDLGHSNISFREADAQALPFPDAEFDAVTCRWGVMYFPEPVAALREFRRVLRPGGRAVLAAWGPFEQPFFQNTVGVLKRYVQTPPPEPGAPTPFVFAEPGSLSKVLRDAGFAHVREALRMIPAVWDGPPEEHWRQFQDTAAPFKPLIESLSPEIRRKVDAEVIEAMRPFFDSGRIEYPLHQVIVTGIR